MEEQQIQKFVRRYSTDSQFRSAMALQPEQTLSFNGFSLAVAQVIQRLMPQLAGTQPLDGVLLMKPFFWIH